MKRLDTMLASGRAINSHQRHALISAGHATSSHSPLHRRTSALVLSRIANAVARTPVCELLEQRQLLAAQLVDDTLKMEVISAYNLVVDSNIESPSGSSPQCGVSGCKGYQYRGNCAENDIYVRFGDLANGATWVLAPSTAWTGTPGIYPTTTVASPYSGHVLPDATGGGC